MNIAIVDDLKSDSDLLKSILLSYAYENSLDLSIETFLGGEEFLSEYESYNYTLIFMDIFMNGITGIETAKKIHQNFYLTEASGNEALTAHYQPAFIQNVFCFVIMGTTFGALEFFSDLCSKI